MSSSSRHTSPRRLLSATAEQWKEWDHAARAHGMRWSTWARKMLDLHTRVMVVCSVARGGYKCTLERGHRGPHYTGPFDDDDVDDDSDKPKADIHSNGSADIHQPRRLLR